LLVRLKFVWMNTFKWESPKKTLSIEGLVGEVKYYVMSLYSGVSGLGMASTGLPFVILRTLLGFYC
jgi:hypothetical protein